MVAVLLGSITSALGDSVPRPVMALQLAPPSVLLELPAYTIAEFIGSMARADDLIVLLIGVHVAPPLVVLNIPL